MENEVGVRDPIKPNSFHSSSSAAPFAVSFRITNWTRCGTFIDAQAKFNNRKNPQVNFSDQHQYLDSYPPTPPLTQQ